MKFFPLLIGACTMIGCQRIENSDAPPPQVLTGKEAARDFIDLSTLQPAPILDIRYATPNNFTGQILYPEAKAYLHRDPAQALQAVIEELAQENLQLKVFDAYRPLSVQKKMFELVPDERYVSNPAKSLGRHTRGTAVDVTLTDAHGKELTMPTVFDDFSERAHLSFTRLPATVIAHREKLKQVMEKHGFQAYAYEWWHYDWKGWQSYPPRDIGVEEVAHSMQP
jgi:D-alanyl-D-alanine dipeptidase